MSNELVLAISLVITYTLVIVLFKLFKEAGLYLCTIVATIAANIEALIIVDAFGMEMTLGNILFASTFLVTDIMSEIYGKKTAQKAVYLGIATSVVFILITQSWFLYTPNENDWVMPSIEGVFSNTPRMMLVGVVVYVIVQMFDVWIYHRWWKLTEKKFGDSKKFLWLRNNGSTLVSQLLNSILFTWGAFYGIYETGTLVSISISSYIIFVVLSLADTPFIYMARRIYTSDKKKVLKSKEK